MEITPAATVEARVSVVPETLRSAPPAASQQASLGLGVVMPTPSPEPLLLSGENVSSMMVMTMPSSMAAAPLQAATPCTSGGSAPCRDAEAEAQTAVQKPQEQPSWLRLSWLRLPWLGSCDDGENRNGLSKRR
jgi:hypothetical protein